MEGLREPLARPVRAALRRAVFEHARTERRRGWFPPVLHVGSPGGDLAELELDPDEPCDPGLRADVVAALRVASAVPDGLVWLTRAGGLELQDVDAAWLAAARSAYAEAELPLSFVVVTRHGWRDPRSGLERTWARVRV